MWTFLDFRIITILETNLSHSLSLLLRNVRAPPKKRPLQIFRFGFSPINKVDSIFTVHCQINHYLIIYKSLHFTLTPFYINFQTHSHPYPHSLSLSLALSPFFFNSISLSLSFLNGEPCLVLFKPKSLSPSPGSDPNPTRPPSRVGLHFLRWNEPSPSPLRCPHAENSPVVRPHRIRPRRHGRLRRVRHNRHGRPLRRSSRHSLLRHCRLLRPPLRFLLHRVRCRYARSWRRLQLSSRDFWYENFLRWKH